MVIRRDGRSLEFRVTSTQRLPDSATDPELFSSDGPATISPVAYAGAWDPVQHTYEERLVATLVTR